MNEYVTKALLDEMAKEIDKEIFNMASTPYTGYAKTQYTPVDLTVIKYRIVNIRTGKPLTIKNPDSYPSGTIEVAEFYSDIQAKNYLEEVLKSANELLGDDMTETLFDVVEVRHQGRYYTS